MLGQFGRSVPITVIGLGNRGYGQLQTLLEMPDVEISALCDKYPDRLERAAKAVEESGRPRPLATLCDEEAVRAAAEAVIIMTDWVSHIRIAVAAMEAGKYAAMEVGGASSLEECRQLVRVSLRTGKPCMLLENCCYNREEMALLNMVKQGLFGELVHCGGGYQHDLRDEIGMGDVSRHYRQLNFLSRNGELYPTHELGPIAKWLDINRGNRMESLVSMASKARGMGAWLEKHRPGDPLAARSFRQGDVVTTMIRCARGETIFLVHDCTLPRPYSRGGRLESTKGIWMEDNRSIFLEGISPEDPDSWDRCKWQPFDSYLEEYEHPLWREYLEYGMRGGHGGMDFLVLRAFLEAVQKEENTPIDVYDTASWMAITPLSEQSISMGSMPVPIPDFTDGRWIGREPAVPGPFALDAVYPSFF